MAFDWERHGELRLHCELPPTLRNITLVVSWLETLHVITIWPRYYLENVRFQNPPRPDLYVPIFTYYTHLFDRFNPRSRIDELPLGLLIDQLNSGAFILGGTPQLECATLRRTSSFDASFEGLGDVLHEVRETLDPLSRKERREELRHSEVMNHLEEQSAASELHSKRVQGARDDLHACIEMNQMLLDVGAIDREEMLANVRAFINAQDAAANVLREVLRATPEIEGQEP